MLFRPTVRQKLACCLVALMWLVVEPGLEATPFQAGEDDGDRYDREWLQQDVAYIISDEEEDVFQRLRTPEEKERFIEQFWHRRDPDPLTSINEFKQEHYRRLAYANESFQSGVSGWKTDRGRVFIIHGPPDELQRYPSGGRYLRDPLQGGGSTAAYPFERWRYRNIEGLGTDIEVEFVDSTWAGEYRLARDTDEKDALMRVPNTGLTRAERLGRTRKMDRPYFQPGQRGLSPLPGQLAKDSPFARYERQTRLTSARPAGYTDLESRVRVELSFARLRHAIRSDVFSLAHGRALVAVTLALDSQDLEFIREGDSHVTRLAIYGSVTDIGKNVVEEFEEELRVGFPEGDATGGPPTWSLYQRTFTLNQGGRYRLDLVIKDLNNGRIGTVQTGLHPPRYPEQGLSASSMVLSDLIVPLGAMPGPGEMFVIGDIKVRPAVDNRFLVENRLGLYLQLYNLEMDQADGRPQLETRYRILRQGLVVMELAGGSEEGVRIYPDGRVALVKNLPGGRLRQGRYQLQVQIDDQISGDHLDLSQDFELIGDRAGDDGQMTTDH